MRLDMKAVQPTYDIMFRGRLDPPLLALIAEYDLGDLPAAVALHGLVVDQGTLDALLDRAHALGVTVTRLWRVDDERDPVNPTPAT